MAALDDLKAKLEAKKGGDSEEAMRACTEIDAELAELRVAYDQYFLGAERRPPTKQHEATKKRVRNLKNQFVRQTAAKFRIESISQKLLTYERLWERTLKEIESGTYKRHLFRAKRHAGHAKPAANSEADDHHFDVDEDLDLSDLDSDGGSLDEALADASAAVSKPAPVVAPPPPVAAPPPPVFELVPSVAAAVPTIAPMIPTVAPLVKPPTPAPPSLVITAPHGTSKPPPKTGMTPALAQPAVGAPAQKPATLPPRVIGMTPPAAQPPAAPPVAAARPSTPPAASKPPPPKAPAPVAAEGGLSEQKIKAIYDAYVMAKKRCGEDTSKLSLTSVADTLKKQVPALMKQHAAKSVEFKVVIKDGKAVLRALPKE